VAVIKNKNALHGYVFAIVMLLSIDCGQVIAVNPNRNKTSWGVVNQSLTELLDDGWKLINQSANRVAIPQSSVRDSTGVGTITNSGYDEEMFTFMLSKNGKYVICLISNPSVVQGTYSSCRSLN
jgi:hypothetical protein